MTLVKMSKLLSPIRDNSYAIGAFNVSNMEMTMGAVKAAEELQAPLLLQIAESRLAYSPLSVLGPLMLAAARQASVPVAVHLDHGTTWETIEMALKLGFTSVMFDGSKYPLKQNIAMTRKIKELCNSYGAEIEGEVGCIGGAKETYSEDELLTTVEGAEQFIEETGVDALAIGIGTAHGHYTQKPKLHIGRLKEIASVVECPLVLHGGTGLTREDFWDCIHHGIRKINIATASYDSVAAYIRNTAAVKRDAGYFDFSTAAVEGTYKNVKKYMRLFGMEGKVK
ncbi:MAG: ketose-bisphosphate aldolase [Megasphaera sp.]|jgi:fructose-bisphosphate aldolase class II|uniref:ketose-bisphosphate aldolase n=1 Tax=Megasphaera sueciensis TaxID=349094 RepID=UPI003D030902|nr:ketose-bisphosphate aldolase [Megasphaera sp.]MCI1823190.1 ketose-bisphosphate aldolase [Megasphaera sp.]